MLIRMDWMEEHWSLVKYKNKTINFLTKGGARQEIHGIKRAIKLQPITTNKLSN